VITLTRLSGTVFALNSDLIERVDSTPDTVITMIDGTKYVVVESLRDVVDAVKAYRGELIAASAHLETGTGGRDATDDPVERGEPRRLTAVPTSPRRGDPSEA
jgi:flagellar protein FlbD